MDKNLMLKQLIDHYSGGSNKKFAELLGVKPQTISTWTTRNTFDVDLIYSKCENISAEWLLGGTGDMIKKTNIHQEDAEHCPLCAEKERIILSKEQHIEDQKRMIDYLINQLNDIQKSKDHKL